MAYGFRRSDDPRINVVWWADVDEGGFRYTEAPSEFWGLAFGRLADGTPTSTLIGPSTRSRELEMVAGERHWGVEFAAHVFLRRIDKLGVLDELRRLPCDEAYFELAGVRFPVEPVERMEALVAALSSQGVLLDDQAVARALSGDDIGYSARNTQRVVAAATGLGRKRIEQLRRARRAYLLLHEGLPLAEAAVSAGYADQAHMTRAFRDLAGLTPARILDIDADPFSSRPA